MADLADLIREHLEPVPTIDQWARWMRTTRDAILAVLDMHHEEDGCCAACIPAASVEYGSPVLQHEKYPCREVWTIAHILGIDPDEEPLTRGIGRDL